ncbi:MAG: chemotaxis protein CheW [Kiritimatiellae bacterium]|nr:chemotaxis protein CheW [Kiritimatiellia bacterium]MDD4736160.1 chemotaxis protein CheW [Kiritimatiellia bacterium]
MGETKSRKNALPNDCWNRIGVFGSNDCPELERHAHCRNCGVYTAAGRALFDRPPPEGFVEEWTTLLSHAKETAPSVLYSVLVFRVGTEWYALKTGCLQEVLTVRPIQYVPGRSDARFLGLVNVHGELAPCISAAEILGVGLGRPEALAVRRRMLVAGYGARDRFVLECDEIHGVRAIGADQVGGAPASVEQSEKTYVSHVLTVDEKHAGLLDEDRLCRKMQEYLERSGRT